MRKMFFATCALACLLVTSPQVRAEDNVRIGATATLGNDGFFNNTSVGPWSPGFDLRVSDPLASWTSLGIAVGYQRVVRNQLYPTTNVAPQDIGHVWLEWSVYAPLLSGRLELGGRAALGLARAFTTELSGGPAVAIYGTATYWVTSWLGGTLDLGGSMSIFSTKDDYGDGAKPEGLGVLSAKVGLVARF